MNKVLGRDRSRAIKSDILTNCGDLTKGIWAVFMVVGLKYTSLQGDF
jgi:hypothetical protein